MPSVMTHYVKIIAGLALPALPCIALAATTAPMSLKIAPLSVDDHSVVLTWQAPVDISQIQGYQILKDGKVITTARDNNQQHAASAPYIKSFYQRDSDHFAAPIVWQSATIDDLSPNQHYQFAVRTIAKDGSLSTPTPAIAVTTTVKPTIVSIADYGARGDGKTLNTQAIQKAIDACPSNCQLVIPSGTFKTGSLFLKSNMTLHLNQGAVLLGSTNPADYPAGYKLYPYSQTMRPASLINAIKTGSREAGTFTNIRITGPGTIDGNGWKQTKKPYTDTLGQAQPHYIQSSSSHYAADGILAKNQVKAALANGMNLHLAYGQMRSSLITLIGVKNLYISGITMRNPADHGLMILTSRNVAVNSVKALTFDANNGDGVELGNTQQAMVFNSYFDTGDDSINFAAGTGKLASVEPSVSHVRLFNNFFHHGHGAVVLGSHTGAGMSDITAQNSVVDGSNIGLRIKSSTIIGGGVSDIHFENMALKNIVNNALTITLKYTDPSASIDYPSATTPVEIGQIHLSHVSVDGISGTLPSLNVQGAGTHQSWYSDVTLDEVKLRNVTPTDIEDLKNSQFNQVDFLSVKGSQQPWGFHHVQNLLVNGRKVSLN